MDARVTIIRAPEHGPVRRIVMQGVLERWRVGKQAVVGRLIIDTANVLSLIHI